MASEVVSYMPGDRHIKAVVECNGRSVMVALQRVSDEQRKRDGYVVWLRPYAAGFASIEEAMTNAQELIERMCERRHA